MTSTFAGPIRPTPLHPLEEGAPLTLQDTRSTFDSVVPARPESSDLASARSCLPTRGESSDALPALDKLERLQKTRQAKRNWRRGTGISYASNLLHPNRKKGGKDDDDTHSSSDDDDVGRARDEVKLMITGNPIVGRVVNAASRAKGRFRGTGESPETSPQNDNGPSRFPFARPGSSFRRRFGTAPTSPTAEVPLAATVSFSPPLPSETFRQPTPDRIDPLERPKSRGLSAKPELVVVDEEGQPHGAPEDDGARPPRLGGQSASNTSHSPVPSSYMSSATSSPGISPGASPAVEMPTNPMGSHSSISSYTGGPIHDEPEAHMPASPSLGRLGSPSPPSLSDASTDDEDDGTDTMSGSDDENTSTAFRREFLSLQHGDDVTKEQLKRRKKLLRREIKRRKAQGEPLDDLEDLQLPDRKAHLGRKVSTRVSKGIHYASGQSRNRRAIERYSPHPGILSLQTSGLSRSSSPFSTAIERSNTPLSAITPSVSQNQAPWATASRRDSVASSRRSSITGMDSVPGYGDENDISSFLRRFNTADRSTIVSSRNSIRNYLHAPNVLKRHRQKKWEVEMAALERSAAEEAEKHDPDAELDQMLGKFAQQQAPAEAGKVKYEFDVLYENQRGLLVFGITKFSPRTLFQWDPSPWTSMSNQKSPYNIANAQLPDPSWEWVYPEWFIDMTGDTDEAGWQYSGNFGRRFWPNIHFPHGKVGLPKAGVEGLRQKDARNAEKQEKRQQKESTREDDGFEALKRSARARSNKWTGSPDAFTFVRRRRWLRLRRRKPLVTPATKLHDSASHSRISSPVTEKMPREHSLHHLDPTTVKPGQSDGESSLSGSEESDTTSEDDERLYAPARARASSFLARRLPGHLSNGPDPTKSTDDIEIEKLRRHARQFTGTIRELKSLLPSIIAMDREARTSRTATGLSASQSSHKWAMLKLKKVDARNPFISWRFVKSRLQDDDMAFASSTLRGIERKYQQRRLATTQAADASRPNHRRIPSGLMSSSAVPKADVRPFYKSAEQTNDDEPAPANKPSVPISASLSANNLFKSALLDGNELTREALVEINFARVLRVLKACKIDRQRLDLWKLWLGTESLDNMLDITRIEDLSYLGLVQPEGEDLDFAVEAGDDKSAADVLGSPQLSGGSSFRYRQRAEKVKAKWRASVATPDPSDVWDVLERKLDEVLLLFEFQSDRAKLIKLLLTVHEQLHPEHQYRDKSLRAAPLELAPAHDSTEMASSAGGAFGSRRPTWQKAGVPRLEFFADLQAILAALPGNEATTNAGYITRKPPTILDELETVAMPMDFHHQQHHHPQQQYPRAPMSLVEQLEAQAQSAACLDENSPKPDEEQTPRMPSLPLPYRKSMPPFEPPSSTSETPSPTVESPSAPTPRSILTPPPNGAAPSQHRDSRSSFCPSGHVTFCSTPSKTPSAPNTSTSEAPPSTSLAVPSFRRHGQPQPPNGAAKRMPRIPARSNSVLQYPSSP